MKNTIVRFCIWCAIMVAIAWANNFVLLQLHPLSYYYTAPGWWMSAAVSVAEAAVIWPVSSWAFKRFILKPLTEEES